VLPEEGCLEARGFLGVDLLQLAAEREVGRLEQRRGHRTEGHVDERHGEEEHLVRVRVRVRVGVGVGARIGVR